MYEQLKKSFDEKVSLTDEEWELCKNSFIPKKMRKRQFFHQEGDVCNRIAFIEKGALFSYSVDEKGIQHVLQFGFEGWWISDLYSFFTQNPSKINIEVLENCELLLMDRAQHESLMKAVPAYSEYVRLLYQNAFIALQQRIENALGLTAEEKYTRFLNQFPSCLNRVPLNLIASFLGITPETLSRIRGKIMG